MAQPDAPDDATHDPGPLPDEIEVDRFGEYPDDGDAGALAAAEAGHYTSAYADPHPIAEVAE